MPKEVFAQAVKSIIDESGTAIDQLQKINESIFHITNRINSIHVENETDEVTRLRSISQRVLAYTHHLEDSTELTTHLKTTFQMEETPPSTINQGFAIGNTKIAFRHFRSAHANIKRLEEMAETYLMDKQVNTFERFRIFGRMYELFINAESDICQGIFALRIAYNHALSRKILKELVGITLTAQDLQQGDIVLSYKTSPYLQHHLLSRLVSIAQHEKITHAAIVAAVKGDHVEVLAASGEGGTLGVFDIKPEHGECWFVFRPDITKEQKQALKAVVDKWIKEVRLHPNVHKFAEYKSWIAVIIGYLMAEIVLHADVVVMIPNVTHSDRDYFCSDIIDKIFKEVGIHLVPRSRYDGVVGPAEFFVSPYLKNIGIYFNKNDESIKKEQWSI